MSARDKVMKLIRDARKHEVAGVLSWEQIFRNVIVGLEDVVLDMALQEQQEKQDAKVYITHTQPTVINMAKIVDEVAQKHGLTTALILGTGRQRFIAAARHEAMWRIRQETGATLAMIGKVMGGRDHSTVLYSVAKHERLRLRGLVASRDKVVA